MLAEWSWDLNLGPSDAQCPNHWETTSHIVYVMPFGIVPRQHNLRNTVCNFATNKMTKSYVILLLKFNLKSFKGVKNLLKPYMQSGKNVLNV